MCSKDILQFKEIKAEPVEEFLSPVVTEVDIKVEVKYDVDVKSIKQDVDSDNEYKSWTIKEEELDIKDESAYHSGSLYSPGSDITEPNQKFIEKSKRKRSKTDINKNHKKGIYICYICEFKSVYKGNLSKHIKHFHSGGPTPSYKHKDTPIKKNCICNICGYKTWDKSRIAAHVRVHMLDKPFSCTECKFKTKWESQLAYHMKKHTGERPYACKLCEYTAIHKHNLANHMRSHTGEPPEPKQKRFMCSVCEYKTWRRDHFTDHVRTHTGEKPFICCNCGYQTSRKSHLKTHMKIHEKEPYECYSCGFKVSRKNTLIKHINAHVKVNDLKR